MAQTPLRAPVDLAALATAVKAHARALGFDLVGIADAAPFPAADCPWPSAP